MSAYTRAARFRSITFGAIALTVVWLGIVAKYVENRAIDFEGAQRDLQNFVQLSEENVLRSIGEMDKALLYLRRAIETAGELPDFHRIANTTDLLSELIVQVAIIDDNGIMRASNIGPQPAPPIDLSDREHYRFHVGRSTDQLFVSKPVIGRASGKWSIQLTRKFHKSDQSFGGVVVASFNPDHFKRSYGRINLGAGASYALVGTDGVIRALSGGDELVHAFGQDLSKTALFPMLLTPPASPFLLVAPLSKQSRLTAVHPIAGFALSVVASLPVATVFADANRSLRLLLVASVLISILICIATHRFWLAEKMGLTKDRQLFLTLEHMSQGIMLVTKDFDVPVMNGKCAKMLGLPEPLLASKPKFDEIVRLQSESGEFSSSDLPDGKHPMEVFGPEDVDGRFECYERTRPDGTVIEVRSSKLEDGGFVRTFSDITQRRQAQSQADKLAAEDALTGLANRRNLTRALDLLVEEQAKCSQACNEFAVLYMDLDRFKTVNDTQGHAVGDQLLLMVAERLRTSLRSNDFIARIGGDEFAILLSLDPDRESVESVAQRLVDKLGAPYAVNGLHLLIGASIGIAIAPDDGHTSHELLVAADLALYAAKTAGRSTYRFFSNDMNEGIKARQRIETDLHQAIVDRQLELHYQPIINLKTNSLVGFEALARWHHPTLGMIPPDKFIPIAEDSGQIQVLGRWVLEEACKEAAHWPDNLTVAVNLSPLQFANPGLVEMI